MPNLGFSINRERVSGFKLGSDIIIGRSIDEGSDNGTSIVDTLNKLDIYLYLTFSLLTEE